MKYIQYTFEELVSLIPELEEFKHHAADEIPYTCSDLLTIVDNYIKDDPHLEGYEIFSVFYHPVLGTTVILKLNK